MVGQMPDNVSLEVPSRRRKVPLTVQCAGLWISLATLGASSSVSSWHARNSNSKLQMPPNSKA